ncbi:hypothetical protein AVDCRST_MAG81-5085 [uncultured Synechococcales cyanobacterium]|uniref:Transposase n=1 Tax=uncultured Synechococcales cyanobacterium TaxID=1936017 RepID=A0A6J4VV97_9CYAN|nr:hypothetical protein AVDCRST_MAG81-5085 [uncultured Synechococcales cyanobacterium]
MTRSKLSDADKQEILALSRESLETASTLAERYGVSSTTIRRTLKSALSSQEYETLSSQKQTPKPSDSSQISLPLPQGEEFSEEVLIVATPSPEESKSQEPEPLPLTDLAQQLTPVQVIGQEKSSPVRRSRKRSSAIIEITADQNSDKIIDLNIETAIASPESLPLESPASSDEFDTVNLYDSQEPEGFPELEADLGSVLEELDDEDFEDDLDNELQDSGDDTPTYTERQLHSEAFVHVLPLSEAAIPRTCYLVIDRFAELITRPLQDFGDLGQIPSAEVQENTLPIFDNHRVARRFSNRTQRVIKIPNGNMLQKACSHLHSKGITRLLINGQVYSLY